MSNNLIGTGNTKTWNVGWQKICRKIIRQKNRVGMENGEIFNIVARKGSLVSEI